MGRRDVEGLKGRFLFGYGFIRLFGGVFEVLGRVVWVFVLYLLLGYLEFFVWVFNYSDNRKVNIFIFLGLGSG